MSIPRPEYPRPQLVRENWINLNGEWGFETDNAKNGKEKEFYKRKSLSDKITVPFCPESILSGIGNTDFIDCVWYRREIDIPKEWQGKTILLHFGAVDYEATVYINGEKAAVHKGGYTSFTIDITKYLKESGNYITVCAEDDVRSGAQATGKQCDELKSAGCLYTRTTGIWQTVWMECVDKTYIKNIKITPNAAGSYIDIVLELSGDYAGCAVAAKAYYGGVLMGECSCKTEGFSAALHLNLKEKHLWDIGCGNLYDLEIEILKDDSICDSVKSYFGLRDIALSDGAFMLNGRKVFGRWVLDQGFYPDGIYTAPTDEALKADIEYSIELGFNGARLHEKVFEPRFLYWADRLGYLVWGEYANWGLDHTNPENIYSFLPEWLEAIKRDYSHPSIIGWCPFNETWDIKGHRQYYELIGVIYGPTKALDSTRPVIDTSGNYHVRTDIFDVHDYEQDPQKFKEVFKEADNGIIKGHIWRQSKDRQQYKGEPIFMSEYGGIKWDKEKNIDSWGYGNAPKTEEEFLNRYKSLTETLLFDKNIMAFCYTQLYDVEQEKNGLMTYDRKYKFDPEIIRKINTQKAAIEE